jgi:hypothetical protein
MSFGFYSSYIALWILAIFQGLLTLAIFRQVLELEKRSETWEIAGGQSLVGARAPKFSGVDSRSGRSINAKIFDGRGGVILFLAAHCSVCRHVSRTLQDGVLETLPPLLAICTGDTKGAARLAKRLAPQIPLVLEGAQEAASIYKVSGYPTAVVLDGERRIRAHSGVNSVEELKRLVALTSAGDLKDGELAMAMATAPSGQSA